MMKDHNNKLDQKNQAKITYATVAGMITLAILIPELASAADAFNGVADKILGFTKTGLGKLITVCCFVAAGAMGVGGYPFKPVAGTFLTGLTFASVEPIMKMLF